MRKLSQPERTYLIIIAVALVLLSIKSTALDPYQPSDDMESLVYSEYHQQSLNQESNVLRVKRIVKITPVEQSDDLEHSIKYDYKIKVRYYLLGIIPYWEISDYVYN